MKRKTNQNRILMTHYSSQVHNFKLSIEFVDRWLDDNVSPIYKEQPLAQDWARISKGIEELGESVDAFIGETGQNPRKGLYASREDTLKELADTALTAIYAIQHFTKESGLTWNILIDRARTHRDRLCP
jgi:hypothetical protein